MHEKNWNIQNILLLKSENWLCYKTLLLGKKHERSNKHTRFKQITTSTNLWGRTNQHGNDPLWAFYTDRLLALNLTLFAVVVQTPHTGRRYKYSLSGFPPFYVKGLTSCKMCIFTSISRFSCTIRRILEKSGIVKLFGEYSADTYLNSSCMQYFRPHCWAGSSSPTIEKPQW